MNKSHKVSKTKDRRLVDNLSAIAKQIKREYFYMSDKCLDAIISRVHKDVESVLVIDDAGLQVVRKLYDLGIKDVTLTFYTYDIKDIFDNFVYIISNTFRDLNVKLVSFEEVIKMKFDLVISNPPYGKIGAQITKKIIDDVDYKDFINLLPANDYKRVPELWQYQSDMEPCKDAFEDAAVTTYIAKLHKNKVNNMSLVDYEIFNYVDPQLDRYFKENSKRSHYAIDRMTTGCHSINTLMRNPWDVHTTFIIALRDMNHKSMGGIKSITYKWNVEESIDFEYIIKNHLTKNGQVLMSECLFSSNVEKHNFIKFIYYGRESKFVQKLFTAISCDGTVRPNIFPKVDWTRSWTVEEILKEYNYTDEEIKEVMEDLKNFKGMND